MTARLVALAVVGVLAVSYTLVRYARVGADLFDPAYRVTVELADAAGLFDNSEVTYRGVAIGRAGGRPRPCTGRRTPRRRPSRATRPGRR
ncbi:MlaD family protein [Nonomuraea sp. NPDC004297]